MTVWVVEFNFVNRELLRLAFEGAGHDVTAVEDGASASRLAGGARPPELLVIDVSLPDTDGSSLLSTLRSDPRFNATVAITAFSYRADRDRLLATGFDQVITKPINTRTLLSDIGAEERARR